VTYRWVLDCVIVFIALANLQLQLIIALSLIPDFIIDRYTHIHTLAASVFTGRILATDL
jgi:hypothetical protein